MPDFQSPSDATEAISIQKALRSKLRLENDFGRLGIVAGIDVSYNILTNISRAVIVLMTLDPLELQVSAMAHLPTAFPYIPGLLSFREIPVILEAMQVLPFQPDLLMVDGQGIAHPRRLGIAAHLGVLTDIPSIGVAKSRLTGTCQEIGSMKGDRSFLMDRSERIGTVLRSKERTLPLFVSPGHRIDHETAVEIVLSCMRGYRLPEPTRIADKFSKIK